MKNDEKMKKILKVSIIVVIVLVIISIIALFITRKTTTKTETDNIAPPAEDIEQEFIYPYKPSIR